MSATPELRMIDPTALVIDANVRLDAKADKSLIQSIKQHGVLTAITGQADEDGTVHVRMGQRRTLAAVEAKRESVPVMVLPAETSADEAARIIEQMAENDHRAALTDNDRREAVEQLTILGLTAGQIQRRTSRPKAEVAAALAVNTSSHAREAVEADSLTLEQGAVLAEFEDDHEAIDALMQAAAEGRGFEHLAQRLRDDREAAAVRESEEEAERSKGATILPTTTTDEYPNAAPLSHLVNADDGSDIDPDAHRTCKGHAVRVNVRRAYWNAKGDDEKWMVQVYPHCTDPKECGHRDRYATGAAGQKKADEMTEEEREQAKAARREVIDNNKAWASAETVRREWVATFLTRKTAPKGAAAFIATALHSRDGQRADVNHYRVEQVLQELGVDSSTEAISKASEGRALVIALARVLAAYEADTDRNHWRAIYGPTAAYLTWIAANGYELSAVEQKATKQTN